MPAWVPGTDHASIATETKSGQILKESGKSIRNLLDRERIPCACFWDWKEIRRDTVEQLKKSVLSAIGIDGFHHGSG